MNKQNKKHKNLPYTGEIVNLEYGERILAIMVIGGEMYLSDCDHQDCYEQYCIKHNISSGFDWSHSDRFDEVQKEAITLTNQMFENDKEDVYGFDVFEGDNDQYYLTSHFPSNMEACYDLMEKYAKENGCILGTFFDTSYQVKLIGF